MKPIETELVLIEILQEEMQRRLPRLADAIDAGDNVKTSELRGCIDGLRIAVGLIKKHRAATKPTA